MPYKDIDYNKLAADNEIHSKLYKKAVEINALREGDIPKLKLLTGKHLVARPSPRETYEKQQKTQTELLPIIKAIKDIKPPSSQEIGEAITAHYMPYMHLPAIEDTVFRGGSRSTSTSTSS